MISSLGADGVTVNVATGPDELTLLNVASPFPFPPKPRSSGLEEAPTMSDSIQVSGNGACAALDDGFSVFESLYNPGIAFCAYQICAGSSWGLPVLLR